MIKFDVHLAGDKQWKYAFEERFEDRQKTFKERNIIELENNIFQNKTFPKL